MSTAEETGGAPVRRSVLASIAGPPAARPSSPENMRQAFMLLAALGGAGISGYYTATLDGAGPARLILAGIFAAWLAMIVHTVRSATSARRS